MSGVLLRSFVKYIVVRLVNILLVLIVTLVISILALGPTMDRIILDTVRLNAVSMAIDIESKKPFSTAQERQKFIDSQVEINKKNLGIDEPWYSPKKFFNTIFKVLTLDLGRAKSDTSISGSSNVRDIIFEKLPKTALLFTTSAVIVLILGIYTGAYMAYKSGSISDKLNSGFAVISNSLPIWWVGMIMILLFSYTFDIFPARSTPLTPPSNPFYYAELVYDMLLPLLTIVLFTFAVWSFLVRYFIINILKEDYIIAKRSAGIPTRRIIYSHGLKNAAPPIITVVILNLASSFFGSVILEAVFDWPGLGQLYFKAISVNDFALIIGLTYISALMLVIAVFVADLLYGYFDPRVKVG